MTADLSPLPEHANDLLAMGICPDCAMPGMKNGPRGGISQNVACPTCGAEFNVARWDGEVVMAHRNSVMGQPNEDRLRSVFQIELPRYLKAP